MKKKIQISEGNLISLIKRIVLEQTFNDELKRGALDSALYTRPALQTVASLQQKPETQTVAPTPEELAAEYGISAQTLADRQQQQPGTQPAAQQKKNQNRVCAGGYKVPIDGNYGLCSGGPLVGQLQKYLGIIPVDNKFGPQTEQTLFSKHKIKTITKEQITKLTNKNSVESNTANAQTQQPMQNNVGIVVNLRNVEPNTSFEKAFTRKKDGREVINITDFRGNTFFSTSCKLLQNNNFWNVRGGDYENFSKFPNLVKKLKYNFCSKTATNINVTKLIKGNESAIPKNEQNLIIGKAFRALINPNKTIHIVSDRPEVVLSTDCNNLKTNTFYKNYGQQTYKGKPIVLPALGEAIKPSFCATK